MTAAARRSAARGLVAATLLAAVLTACAPEAPPERLTLKPVRFADLAGWADDRHGEALGAFRRSCARLMRLAPETPLAPAGLGGGEGEGAAAGFGTVADWQGPCAAAAALGEAGDGAARAFFERWFTPYLAADNDESEGLFTGYYEPQLRGAREPGGRYTIPLYRRPADLVSVDLGLFRPALGGVRLAGRVEQGRLRPYDDRTEIEAGSLAGRGLELVWVDDPVDAFFLHIQGSGRVALEDGTVLRLGYAASNGHAYVAIGRELVARGEMEPGEVTMQSIRAWLATHPGEAAALMAANPSYVFFRELEGDGPVGAAGVALTPERSLAVDRRFIALGTPVWLEAADPLAPDRTLRRLMVAQDTGGAIRGPVRGDVFWGAGAKAAERAGRMKSPGRYYLLLPRPVRVSEGT